MIQFINIKSGEIAEADSEPKIAALWSSSDRGINVMQGQDFGWRLAPEVVIEMEGIMQDEYIMDRIANRIHKELEEITEYDVLFYISSKTDAQHVVQPRLEEFDRLYNNNIQKIREENAKAVAKAREFEAKEDKEYAARQKARAGVSSESKVTEE